MKVIFIDIQWVDSKIMLFWVPKQKLSTCLVACLHTCPANTKPMFLAEHPTLLIADLLAQSTPPPLALYWIRAPLTHIIPAKSFINPFLPPWTPVISKSCWYYSQCYCQLSVFSLIKLLHPSPPTQTIKRASLTPSLKKLTVWLCLSDVWFSEIKPEHAVPWSPPSGSLQSPS